MFREYKIDVSWLSRTHVDELAVPGRDEFELEKFSFDFLNIVLIEWIWKAKKRYKPLMTNSLQTRNTKFRYEPLNKV